MKIIIVVLCAVCLTVTVYSANIDDALSYGTEDARVKAVETIVRTKNFSYVPKIINLLNDPSPKVRISVANALLQLNVSESIPQLIDTLAKTGEKEECRNYREILISFADFAGSEKLQTALLKHTNPQVRQQMAILLGEMGDKTAEEFLIKALKDNDFVRFSAIQSLGKIGSEKSVPALTNALTDPVGEIRLSAAKSLCQLKSYKSIPYIFSLLQDKDPTVKSEVESALNQLVIRKTVLYFTESVIKDKRAEVRKYSAKALGILGDESLAPVLFKALEDKEPTVREEALKSLDILVDRKMVFSLCLLLNRKDLNVRTYAVSDISKLGDSRAVPSLLDRLSKERDASLRGLIHKTVVEISDDLLIDYFSVNLKNKNKHVRLCIVETIGKLKPLELLPELSDTLSYEKNPEIKLAMLNTIKEFKDKSALPGLHSALIKEKNIEIKIVVIEVLRIIGDRTSIPALLECLKSGDELLTMVAEELLDKLVDIRSLDYFLTSIKDKNLAVRTYTMKIIKKHPVDQVLPLVKIALKDKDMYIRLDAVHILGTIGDKSVCQELVHLLKDKEEEIRIEAVKSLGQLGDSSVVNYLIKSLNDKSPEVRLETVKVLAEYGDKNIVPELNKLLKKESDIYVQEQIILMLSSFGDKSVIPTLIRKARDIEVPIRKASVETLGNLGDTFAIPVLEEIFINDFSSEVKAEAIKSLAKLGAKEMIPEFMNLLSDPVKNIRDSAREALDILIDEFNCPYLVGRLQSEHIEIRDYCFSTLRKLKAKTATDALFQIIKSDKGKIRKQAMIIIGESADESYLPQFLSVIDEPAINENMKLQLWVIKNIAKFSEKKEVMEYFLKTLKHKDPDIRQEVVKSLKNVDNSQVRKALKYVAINDADFTVRQLAKKILKKK